jgi:hypothetical protein
MRKLFSSSALFYACIPTVAIIIVGLYPQASLWISRGSNWNGTFYISNYDETAYSAYINSLISGKPRKTDPFLGIDEADHESFYSIQVVPAYAIAIPARLLRISTSTAFIILTFFIAIASALAFFWLLRSVTGSYLLSAVGPVIILCFGTAACYEGELRHWIEGPLVVDYLPFFRRYQPGFAFPIFVLFCGVLWKSFSSEKTREVYRYAIFGGLLLSVLIFSYFYLWTSAVAFLGLAASFFVLFERGTRKRNVAAAAIVVGFAAVTLIPYALLIGARATNLDDVQLLNLTRWPDLASATVVIGLIVAAAVLWSSRKGILVLRSAPTAFILATALTPLVLLNQQVITGHSLQPVHYEIFVSNYMALLSVILLIGALLRSGRLAVYHGVLKKLSVCAAIGAFGWGIVEAAGSTSRNLFIAVLRDQAAPAIRFADDDSSQSYAVVLCPDSITGDFLQSVSTLRPLWNPHTSSTGGISIAENKRLFYHFLYYAGFTDHDLAEALRIHIFEATAAVFGSVRALPELGEGTADISEHEIQEEAAKYRQFIAAFDERSAADPLLSYAIVASGSEPDFSRLDKWYERERARDIEGFRVYRLKPKF